MRRVVVIGSGNVAEALSEGLSGKGLVQIYARNRERGETLALGAGVPFASRPEELAPADLYLLAVSDRAVGEVSEGLDFGQGLVAHTAGSRPAGALSERVARKAVLYPLQTFTAGRKARWAEIPLFLETEREEDMRPLEEFAVRLSANVYRADSDTRRKLHLSAVFACNFVNHLWAVAEEILREEGMDMEVIKPLVRETAAKMLESPSPVPLQTGPAVRRDQVTVGLHLEALEGRPELVELYRLLTESIQNRYI